MTDSPESSLNIEKFLDICLFQSISEGVKFFHCFVGSRGSMSLCSPTNCLVFSLPVVCSTLDPLPEWLLCFSQFEKSARLVGVAASSVSSELSLGTAVLCSWGL